MPTFEQARFVARAAGSLLGSGLEDWALVVDDLPREGWGDVVADLEPDVDDLDYPARLATLVVTGVPRLQRDDAGAVVGVSVTRLEDLAEPLRDAALVARLSESVGRHRHDFTSDAHADRPVALLREATARASARAAG